MRSETKGFLFLLLVGLLKGIAEAIVSHQAIGNKTQAPYVGPLDAQNAPQPPFETTQG